jgi:hypothetical protein
VERSAAQLRHAFHIRALGIVAQAATSAKIGAELMADIQLI